MIVKDALGERHIYRCALCPEEWVGGVGVPASSVLEQAIAIGWETVMPPPEERRAALRSGTPKKPRMSMRCPRHALRRP